eukprot:SAG11_NODE_478_length_9117_cov_6.916168_5_plen_117_part_00
MYERTVTSNGWLSPASTRGTASIQSSSGYGQYAWDEFIGSGQSLEPRSPPLPKGDPKKLQPVQQSLVSVQPMVEERLKFDAFCRQSCSGRPTLIGQNHGCSGGHIPAGCASYGHGP